MARSPLVLVVARNLLVNLGMTKPRLIHPNRVYLVTRRCVGREFLFHLTPEVQATWRFLLAVACQRFNMRLIAYCLMSDHVHYVVHDPGRSLPRFTTWLHAEFAKAVNAIRRRWGCVWEPGMLNQPVLADAEKVLDKIAYVLANPVAAGLVRSAWQWPGAMTRPEDYLAAKVIEKPKAAYFKRSQLPPRARLRHWVPPTHAVVAPGAFVTLLREALARHESVGRERHGQNFMGLDRLRTIDWTHRAKSEESRGRGRNRPPKVLATDVDLRKQLLTEIELFEAAYASALERYRRHTSSVAFPRGTWAMVERFDVPTCGPPGLALV